MSLLPAYANVVIWISLGICMIVFNKFLLSNWHFGYPCFLTFWHCLFASFITQIMSRYSTVFLGSVREGLVTRSIYFSKIVPLALCFALGLVFGNSAYKYISLSYIQMLKSSTPVTLLLLNFAVGREKPNKLQLLIVLLISLGVAMATAGELAFSIVGFVLQFLAIVSDVCRMTLLDNLCLDVKLDSLSTLYYLAPISALFIFIMFLFLEAPSFPYERIATPSFASVLLLNACLAFSLNLAIILLIANTGSLTMALAGLVKDMLIVVFSILIFGSPVTTQQYVGYSISLFGLFLYRKFKEDPAAAQELFIDYQQRCSAIVHRLLCCFQCKFLGLQGGAEKHQEEEVEEMLQLQLPPSKFQDDKDEAL